METSPLETLTSKKDRQELLKTRNPNATENYCKGVVSKFKNLADKSLTMTPWEGAGETFAATTGRIARMGGGVMAFDQWDTDFWKDMKNYELGLGIPRIS